MPANESRGLFPTRKKNLRNLPVDCNTMWYRAQFLESKRSPSKIIHTQRSLFFSHAHTRFVLCLRKGIYLWKRAISKTLRSAEWLKGAAWYSQKNLKNCRFQEQKENEKSHKRNYVVCQREFSFAKIVGTFRQKVKTQKIFPSEEILPKQTIQTYQRKNIKYPKNTKIMPYREKKKQKYVPLHALRGHESNQKESFIEQFFFLNIYYIILRYDLNKK